MISPQDWASDLSLYAAGVKVLPANVKMHNNYAMELKGIGHVEEARKHYKVFTTIIKQLSQGEITMRAPCAASEYFVFFCVTEYPVSLMIFCINLGFFLATHPFTVLPGRPTEVSVIMLNLIHVSPDDLMDKRLLDASQTLARGWQHRRHHF